MNSKQPQRTSVALVQMSCVADKQKNVDKALARIAEAAAAGANIVCLQELFSHRYFAQTKDDKFFEIAESVPGPLSKFLGDCASQSGVVLVGGSIYEKSADGKFYNTSLIYDSSGELLAKYRKMHIPHDPNYYEQHYFSPGDIGYVQINAGKAIVAPLIFAYVLGD